MVLNQAHLVVIQRRYTLALILVQLPVIERERAILMVESDIATLIGVKQIAVFGRVQHPNPIRVWARLFQ